MLIRSQNEIELINTNNVISIFVQDTNVKALINHNQYYMSTLGSYSSREKAMEVLDIIQRYYRHDNPIYVIPKEDEV